MQTIGIGYGWRSKQEPYMCYLQERGLYLADDIFLLCHIESLDLFLLFVKYTFQTYNGSLENVESFNMRGGGQRKKETNKFFPFNKEMKREEWLG